VDPSFATGLAAFALRVAERYPWVDAFTPVNEPLTTARAQADRSGGSNDGHLNGANVDELAHGGDECF
jgi:hypothetical protein